MYITVGPLDVQPAKADQSQLKLTKQTDADFRSAAMGNNPLGF